MKTKTHHTDLNRHQPPFIKSITYHSTTHKKNVAGLSLTKFHSLTFPITLDPKQIVSFEELLMSQVVQQEALTRLLVEKRIFTKDEFLEMVRIVDLEMKR